MATYQTEHKPDHLSVANDAIKAAIANLWTCLPCAVENYNPDAVTVDVQPLIQIPILTEDGGLDLISLPVIPDVPVVFQRAGGFAITFPIKKGDECLVKFSDRNIDLWWKNGGIQPPFDNRKHDLSDGFAYFGPQSQVKKIPDISTEDLEIRNDAGTCKIQVTPDGVINFIGTKSVFHHPVEMKSTLDVDDVIKSLVDVLAASISLKDHPHGGVQPGNGNTGKPK
ncbi:MULTISPECIES: Gp138 family membrane-puncturing spike protein [unclassified Acinetobacter]|uniref:Gp138 family membrane-puncturing spike protein n=1 Tax=unclassified Acinetobacter TaxID=196816 RepID=UPI002934F403|nr:MULTISPECIES: Gp138 family membrane-puncturing spike protein [unclassified Acinetobacter]WOE32188.1 Gp138 family membrane-puncturing spike protein [Acinetobacter sp. SAAs470]WOE37658.1 Gp138 family membrane-puncturing spike protein [Acinetobacter sp. SAAs474]